jgi:hypothetical protein
VSSTVPRNGFNPTWEEEAEFSVNIPDLAILEFKVLSEGLPFLEYLNKLPSEINLFLMVN